MAKITLVGWKFRLFVMCVVGIPLLAVTLMVVLFLLNLQQLGQH